MVTSNQIWTTLIPNIFYSLWRQRSFIKILLNFYKFCRARFIFRTKCYITQGVFNTNYRNGYFEKRQTKVMSIYAAQSHRIVNANMNCAAARRRRGGSAAAGHGYQRRMLRVQNPPWRIVLASVLFILSVGCERSSGPALSVAACGVIEHKWRSGRAECWLAARAAASPRSAGPPAACAAPRRPPSAVLRRASFLRELHKHAFSALAAHSPRSASANPRLDKHTYPLSLAVSAARKSEGAADLGRPVRC